MVDAIDEAGQIHCPEMPVGDAIFLACYHAHLQGYYAIEKGLLEGAEDFYEHKHINSDLLAVNFTNLTDDEFYKELMKANEALLENYYDAQKKWVIEMEHDLYLNRNAEFRGFRHT